MTWTRLLLSRCRVQRSPTARPTTQEGDLERLDNSHTPRRIWSPRPNNLFYSRKRHIGLHCLHKRPFHTEKLCHDQRRQRRLWFWIHAPDSPSQPIREPRQPSLGFNLAVGRALVDFDGRKLSDLCKGSQQLKLCIRWISWLGMNPVESFSSYWNTRSFSRYRVLVLLNHCSLLVNWSTRLTKNFVGMCHAGFVIMNSILGERNCTAKLLANLSRPRVA